MEYIYIAKSKEFPGIVKIGRTDSSVEKRMEELSEEDYGTLGYSGDSQWEAVSIIKVENSEEAEAILHDHFSSFRVESQRELFYTDNPEDLTKQAIEVLDGKHIIDAFDTADGLFSALSIVAIATGLTITASIFAPENKHVKKAEQFMDEWEKRLENNYYSSKSLPKKGFYGALSWSFGVSKLIGGWFPAMVKESVDVYRNSLEMEDYKKKVQEKEKQFLKDGLERFEDGDIKDGLIGGVNYKKGLKHGLLERFQSDGDLSFRGNFIEGKLDGEVYEKDLYGQVEIMNYKNGLLHGSHKKYFGNDGITHKLFYLANYSEGKLHGVKEEYRVPDECKWFTIRSDEPNREELIKEHICEEYKLASKETYQHGKKHGVFEEYDKNGHLFLSEIYLNDQFVK